MIKHLPGAVLATLAIGLAPLTPAFAAPAATAGHPAAPGQAAAPILAASKTTPNPCRTFSTASADVLMGLRAHTRLKEKLTKNKTDRSCAIKHGAWGLVVLTERMATEAPADQPGAGLACHVPAKLGRGSELCEAARLTFVVFTRHGVLVSDTVNHRLPKRGQRIYTFALAQAKHLKA
jgi:hypothetical protein